MSRKFETRFAFSRNVPQAARTARPEVVIPFETEEGALAALKSPPPGAKVGIVRQIEPFPLFIKRKEWRSFGGAK